MAPLFLKNVMSYRPLNDLGFLSEIHFDSLSNLILKLVDTPSLQSHFFWSN
jgi:hypothetical protein